MSLMRNCLLFPMVGLNSEIFAFIADNFTVEVLLQNLWTTLYIHIHTYPPTIHIRTWQKSDFHWLFDSDFAPSALSLRLIFCAPLLYLLWHHRSVTWPDPVIFYHKLRKVCPRGYWKAPYALLNDLGVIAKKNSEDASPPLRVRWLKRPLSDVPRWVNNCIVFSLLYYCCTTAVLL